MTEQEIIYGILETIRAHEITDDEKVTEAILRTYLAHYRNEDIKNVFEISEEHYQNIDLVFKKENNVFNAPIPGVVYERGRIGFLMNDFIASVSLVSKEEAVNSQKSRMYKPAYIGYITNGKFNLLINEDTLETMPASVSNLKKILLSPNPVIEISAILSDVSKGKDYDWTSTPYPLSANRVQTIRKNILRQEFGITVEVKKDEVQNSRQDNIIYQDESKLYK